MRDNDGTSIIDILRSEGVTHADVVVTIGTMSAMQIFVTVPIAIILSVIARTVWTGLLGTCLSLAVLVIGVNSAERLLEKELRHR